MILTKRQKQILDYIQESLGKNGYAPSLIEISRHFNLHSISTIHKHLVHLEEKGLIRRHWNRARAIEVTEIVVIEDALVRFGLGLWATYPPGRLGWKGGRQGSLRFARGEAACRTALAVGIHLTLRQHDPGT